MQTAREIGFSPKFEILSEAELINEFVAENMRVLTLIDVMRETMNANLDLKIEEGSVKSARKDLSLARSDFFPSLTLGAAGKQIDEEQAENSMGQQTELTTSGNIKVDQLIFSEERMGNVTVQEHLLRASKFGFDQRKLDVILDAATAYFNVLRAKTAMNIQNENVTLTRKNLEISKQREAAGYSGRSDVYRWESSLATATTGLLEAKNNFQLTKIQLNQLLNRPLDEEFTAAEASLSDDRYGSYLGRARAYIDNPDSLSRYTGFLIEEAVLNSPEIRQLDANIASLERRLTSFKLKRFVPAVSLNSEAQRVFSRDGAGSDVAGVDPDNESWSVGLNLSIPLFEGGATSHNISQTKIEIQKLQDQRTQLLQSLELGVRAAVLDLVTKGVTLRSSRKSAGFAEKSLALVQDSYAQGKVSIVDLVDAQNSSLNSNLTALNSVYEFMTSLLETERSVGRFTLLTTPAEQEEYSKRLQIFLNERLK
jgi:outer membrane protein TolC